MARDLAATNDIARKGEITPLQTTKANGSYGGFLSHRDHPKSSKSWISVLIETTMVTWASRNPPWLKKQRLSRKAFSWSHWWRWWQRASPWLHQGPGPGWVSRDVLCWKHVRESLGDVYWCLLMVIGFVGFVRPCIWCTLMFFSFLVTNASGEECKTQKSYSNHLSQG